MGMSERFLVLAGGATACSEDWGRIPFFREAILSGTPPRDLSEIVLQTYLFAGYPRAINALMALNTVAGDYSPREEESSAPDPDDATPDYQERGERLCRIIYGEHYSALRALVATLHPDLDRWMVEEGYGRVLGRPGVSVVTRELAAINALIVLDLARQVRSHLLGARHVGADDTAIEETIHQVGIFASAEAVATAQALWQRLE
jgi:4-carboxymuconolactone decarboxylase